MKFSLIGAAAAAVAAGILTTGSAWPTAYPVVQAVDCPSVDSTTGAVSPAPGPGVNWSGCDLSGADLKFANMTGADLSAATLNNANLLHTTLGQANLSDATFSGATLTVADVRQANVAGTAFGTATLTGLQGSNISGQPASLPANWLVVSVTDASNSTHHYLIGPTANIQGAGLFGANLAGLDLEQLNISNGSLANTNLTGTDLAGANLANVQTGGIIGQPSALPTDWFTLKGYLLGPGANAAGANLAGADLTGRDLQGVNFLEADLSGADLSGLNLDSDDFAQADLIGTNLSNTSLNADLQQANLTSANLTGATITGANLQGAIWLHTTCPDGSDSDKYVAGCLSALDTASPVANPAINAGTAGQNGWYISPVTIAWNWTDDGTIVQGTCPRFSKTSTQGDPVTLSTSCTDLAGNQAQATFAVKIDTTPPAVTVLGVKANRVYVLGAAPKPACQTTDNLSGVALPASVKVSTSGANGVGQFTASCSGAADNAGIHQAAAVRTSYIVGYGFSSGSLRNGETIAKSRHTFDQTFKLTNAAGHPIAASTVATLARNGKVQASMTGPGISRQVVTCTWQSAAKLLRCRITIPGGARKGQQNSYKVTASENVAKSFVVIPPVGAATNPVVIHFS